ncbi:MAG TPA: fructosamine kinase family protein [Acidimicrobiales bacterium]|nr:fructosamine kinase family protein [Acidimicrobiales bacterium]
MADPDHPLTDPAVGRAVADAASAHLGRPWTCLGFTPLDHLASHPSGVLHGEPVPIFAKLAHDPEAPARFRAELAGLALLRRLAGVPTPTPVGPGLVEVDHRSLLLYEALRERAPDRRTAADWRSIGATLARIHEVRGHEFGLRGIDGYYGPLRQDNAPVTPDRWSEFFAERRLLPMLGAALDAGHLPPGLAEGVEAVVRRLPWRCGPEPPPTLLHGDAQQHNFVSTETGAVVIDVAPSFGHPEMDLAQLDVFDPVAPDLLDAYTERRPLDPGFEERRELWRMYTYLAAVTVDGAGAFGRRMAGRLADAVRRFR